MKKLSFFLMAMLVSLTSFAAEINLDFTKIDGFSSWDNSYTKRVVEYDEATVTFTSANKQSGTITNQPVTKGQPVEVVMKDGATLSGVTFVCTQWTTKSQTITLHYSVDGGKNYTSTNITSTNFTITSEELPLGTNAVKITFNSTKNQVGITSCTLVTVEANPDAPKYMVTATPSDEAMGTVTGGGEYSKGSVATLTATPNAGYKFVNWSNGSTDNPLVLEVTEDVEITANFAAKDVYTITWSVNGETTTTSVVEGEALVLPEAPEAPEACSEKVFVGWTTAEEVNADGSDITWVDETVIPTNSVTYYAVFATVDGEEAQETSITKTIKEYAEANSWANETQYKTMVIDENITITITEEGTYHNSGKYYLNGNNWRFYQNESPTITFSAQKGSINSIAMAYAIKNTGALTHNSTNIASGEVYTVNNSSVTFTVGNTGTATNGNIQVTEITVVYTAQVNIYTDYSTTCEAEIEWFEMPLEITNLTTEVMEVEGAKYLQLAGRNDMDDADVMLFLNNYADVDDDYEVNAESSYMTYGGMELTVLEGVMTQTSETDKGTMYNGIVRTYVAEDSLYVAFNLTMYAAPATVLVLTDAIVAINEDLGTLTFNVATDEGGYMAELSGYTAPGVHEGPQICLFETPEVVAYTNYAETSVADGVITLKGEFTSFMGAKFDLTISGKLPVVEPTTITYELNGGELPTATVPTQDSLIAAFKDGYNAYFGVSVATTRVIDNFLYAGAAVNNPTCDVSLFMKDDASPWKWLGDYVLAVTNAQIEAGLLVTLKELATELMWRQSLTGFFLQQAKLDSNYKGNADFTEAGKPEAWGAAYQAAHAVVLPTEPVDAPYTLPTPVKEGYTFVGWYDNEAGTGEAYEVIPAGWAGTLYAIWKTNGPTTDLDNIAVEGKAVKAIINGQVLIMIGDKTFNMMGQQVK